MAFTCVRYVRVLLMVSTIWGAEALSRISQLPQILRENEIAGSVTTSNIEYASNENRMNQVTYLHFPQTGSGFATAVAHYACGDDVPDDVWVSEPTEFFETWGATCNESRFGRFRSGHDPLTSANMDNLESVVAMFREPSQRVLSGYFNNLNGCTLLQRKHMCMYTSTGSFECEGDLKSESGKVIRDPSTISPIEYAKCVENCTANMLTGRACEGVGPVDAERAVNSIDKLGFVGLTEEWELSLCLWHARFGGRVLPTELQNLKRGNAVERSGSMQSYENDTLLGGWNSVSDMQVYRAAASRFWKELDLFKIDRDSCQQMISGSVVDQRHAEVSEVRGQREINPIYYLHVPESGAGFATTVAHHACGNDIPDGVSVVEPREFLDAWGTACSSSRFASFQSGHNPLPANEIMDPSHVVVMLREPSHRALSGYYNDFHDCVELQEKYNCSSRPDAHNLQCDGDISMPDGSFMRDPERMPPIEYAKCVENCTTNMLTGRYCQETGSPDVELAEKLIDELGFVGLSEDWALSVCLWHRKFGGNVLPVELMNVRPGMITTLSKGVYDYDVHGLLGDWRSEADSRVYAAAKNRFLREIREFDIDEVECEQSAASLAHSASVDSRASEGTSKLLDPGALYYHVFETGESNRSRRVTVSAGDLHSSPKTVLVPFYSFGADALEPKRTSNNSVSTLADAIPAPYVGPQTITDFSERSFDASSSMVIPVPALPEGLSSETSADFSQPVGQVTEAPIVLSLPTVPPVPQIPTVPMVPINSMGTSAAMSNETSVPLVNFSVTVKPYVPPTISSDIKPIHYLHMPRSGSGLATVVAHHVCGNVLPPDEVVVDLTEFIQKWGSLCDTSSFGNYISGSEPLSVVGEEEMPHVVVMMRDPLQRIVSGYYHSLEDCADLQRKFHCGMLSGTFRCDGDIETDGGNMRDQSIIPPLEYGMCIENCTTNMLTGFSCSDRGQAEVERAVRVIDELGFVGLTDEWELSVCLWHRRFGGSMLPAEIVDASPSLERSVLKGITKHDEHALLGYWRPEADQKVYEAATQRFWREIEYFNVDRSACDSEVAQLRLMTHHGNPDSSVAKLLPASSIFDVGARTRPAATPLGGLINDGTRPDLAYAAFDINPINYVHIPLSGSGLATVVAHHACGAALPEDEIVLNPSEFFQKWGSACDSSRFGRFVSEDVPVTATNAADIQHVVVMIRDPSQRILSGYFHDLHDCSYLQQKHGCGDISGKFRCVGDVEMVDGTVARDPNSIHPVDYGICVENCTANILTGRACADSGPVDVDAAVRLVNELGFVGLTEEWALSVCLWHKRFGGRVLPAELKYVQPRDAENEYNENALLGQWRPRADYEVFGAAVERFWKEIKYFGIDRDVCEREAREMMGNTLGDTSMDLGGVSQSSSTPRMDATPFQFLYVPLSGLDFATIAAQHECSSLIHEHFMLESRQVRQRLDATCGASLQFIEELNPTSAMDANYVQNVVLMMRDPSQRVLSGYYNDLSDCSILQLQHNCGLVSGKFRCDGDRIADDGAYVRDVSSISPVEYGKCVENCTANVLTGHLCADSEPVDVGRALMLVDQIGFVGLVDKWALSICLWHKRFGGRMTLAELTRKQSNSKGIVAESGVKYDEHALLGYWRPGVDSLLFEAARRRFFREMEEYGVDPRLCEAEANALLQSEPTDGVLTVAHDESVGLRTIR